MNLTSLFTKLFATPITLKAGAFGMILGYILPSETLIETTAAAGIMVLLDTITGMMAAWQTGEALRSAKFGRMLAKMLVYPALVAAISVSLKVLPPPATELRIAAVTGVLWIIIARELLSIIENTDKMDLKIVPKWVRNLVRDQHKRLSGAKAPE